MTTVDLCSLITYDALRMPRTLRELRSWIKDVETAFIATEEGRKYLRLTSGPSKRFREEIWPVEQFLTRFGAGEDFLIRFPCDNGQRDAEVFEPYGRHPFALLEVVTALDGQDDRLRRELVTITGHAPAFGPIRRDKVARSIVAESTAVLAEDVVRNTIALIDKAIKAKIGKAYPPQTWLLVSFFDSVLMPESLDRVTAAARSSAEAACFERIYLVGQSQKYQLLARVDRAS